MFVLQEISKLWFGSFFLERFLSLTHQGFTSGAFWTIFSYAFLHGNLIHLFFNCLVIFFTGIAIASDISPLRFCFLYTLSVLLGGAFWLILNHQPNAILVGASAGAMGMMLFFCCLYPYRPVTILIFFVIPITVKPKWLAWGLFIYEFMHYISSEVTGNSIIASSAHLGGMLGGLIMFIVYKRFPMQFFRSEQNERKKLAPPTTFKVNILQNSYTQEELDIILKKVSQSGFGSLTESEKEILNQAKKDHSL
jgi:membrane associated rhomboid family serine protease